MSTNADEHKWWKDNLTPSQMIWLILEQQIGHEVTIDPNDARKPKNSALIFFTRNENGTLTISQKAPSEEE